ncbi:MAG: 4Fe-4S dicluster domain-containing protein, partial [Acutalibacteraceae bacterium]
MTDFNISKKAVENADSCRFCWMCHHVCPVGNATGLERNTARARALAVSMVARGGVELTDDVVNNIYECTLCGGCTNVC